MRGTLTGKIYTKNEDDNQQLHLGGESWTINLQELPGEAEIIEYITPTSRYVISRQDALKYGFIRNLGGEDKLVVPLKRWQEDAVALNEEL